MKFDQYGSLLIPVIMSKLPSEVKLRIAREATDEVWKINDLMEVIKREVEAREACDGVKPSLRLKLTLILLPTPQLLVHLLPKELVYTVLSAECCTIQLRVTRLRTSRLERTYF